MSSPARGPRPLMVLLGLASLITALDFTIVYVALPDIGREIGFSAHGLQWVVSAYAIAFGGFLLLGGRLSDLLGHRRVFVAGMGLFAVGSLLGGMATTPALLLGARVIQGWGAAAVFPATLSLVNTAFGSGPRRDRALTVWAAAGASGLSLGALFGGVLTQTTGWRGVFLVNVPLAVVGIVGALSLLSADRPARSRAGFDLTGALTSTAGISLVVLATAQGSELGWSSPVVLGGGLAGVALIAVFLRIEARTERPLAPLHLLGNRSLAAALAVIVLFGMSMQSIPYILTLHFQTVLGLTALQAGLGFLVPTASIAVSNLVGEWLIARLGVRAVLTMGLVLGAVGAVALAIGVTADSSYLAAVPGLAVSGIGMGLVFPAMFNAATSGVPDGDSGVASGMASTALQIGTAAGLAVLVGVITDDVAGPSGRALEAAIADGLRTGLVVIAVGALLAVPAARAVSGRDQARTGEPQRSGEASAAATDDHPGSTIEGTGP